MAKGPLSRMADVVRAEVDDLLSRMEDPKKMVRQMILDMEDALDQAVAAVGRAVANEKMLERRLSEKKEEALVWQQKAEAAMDAGDEDLARKTLFHKVAADETVQHLESAQAEAREVTGTLKHRLGELKTKLASAQARQGVLVLQKRAARLRADLYEGAGAMDSEAFARYDQFCREVAREEATAQVYAEISGQVHPELDATFAQLEQKKRVEAALEAMKTRRQTP